MLLLWYTIINDTINIKYYLTSSYKEDSFIIISLENKWVQTYFSIIDRQFFISWTNKNGMDKHLEALNFNGSYCKVLMQTNKTGMENF